MKHSDERRIGLARVLSKRGLCSRTQAAQWIMAGRVTVNGRVIRDAQYGIVGERQRIAVDGVAIAASAPLYVMLNKPRGLVTSTRDERARDTVYRCFDGAGLPWMAPAGRLDKASEGLLLFSNDPQWAAHITDPATGPDKTYHVQVGGLPDASVLSAMTAGVLVQSERLSAAQVRVLRQGGKNAWLEIVLEEGRNRQIRRLLEALDFKVLRLLRVAIGPLQLGLLPKGQWRRLSAAEAGALGPGVSGEE